MPTRQGDVALLQDPVAQQLLQSRLPAQFAYNWNDGTPRVVPIGFHWNGKELVLGTPPDAPKMHVLHDGTPVALTINTDTMPYKVLLVRGTVHIDTVEGIAPADLTSKLAEQGINIRHTPEPELNRVATGFYNTETDIDRLAEAITAARNAT